MGSKGQIITEETRGRMRQAQFDHTRSKYNWALVESYLDVEIKNGSVKRTNKYITLREFKENVESNISLQQMQKEGISNKITQFFSNLCQGKIKLTKEQFIEDYHSGISLDEIGKKYKVTREDLTYLRQLYDIKRKGPTFINRKKTEVPLTEEQKEILYGSLMGDAKKQHSYSCSSAGFVHGEGQKEYLLWKHYKFASVVSKKSLRFEQHYDKRYDKKYGSWRFYTSANTDVEEILTKFYKNKEKKITEEILERLTPLAVAVWYQDDGTTNFPKKMERGSKVTPEVRICTDSFSKEECELIVKWFKEKYNISSHLRENRKNQYRIILKSTSVQDFFNLISPHIIPSMRYKVEYKEYREKVLK